VKKCTVGKDICDIENNNNVECLTDCKQHKLMFWPLFLLWFVDKPLGTWRVKQIHIHVHFM